MLKALHGLSSLIKKFFPRDVIFVLGEMLVTSGKYDVSISPTSTFATSMKLTVKKFQKQDAGSYKCVAKNSLGEVESNIRLYGKYLYNVIDPLHIV